MNAFFKRLSTRLYLTFALSMCLVLFALLSVSIKVQEEALYKHAEDRLLQVTDVFRTSLELVLQTRQESLTNLAKNLQRWETNDHPSLADDSALRQLFDHVWVVNRNGDVVDEWPRLGAVQERLNIASRELFRRASETGGYFIGQPESSYYTQEPIVNAVVPMFDSEGDFMGAVIGMFSLYDNTVLNRIASTRVGDHGYVAISTNDGTIIAHPDRRLILERLPPGENSLLDSAIHEGWQGVGETTDSTGKTTLQTMRQLGNSGWILGAVLSLEEAMQPAYELRRVQVIVGLISLLISLSLLSWILRAYLRPLNVLQGEVIDIQQGRAHQLTEPGIEELRQVVSRFNDLLAQNEANQQTLQQRQAYLDIILATSAAGLFMADTAGKIEYTNERTVEITGFPPEELKSSSILNNIAEEHRERLIERWKEALKYNVPMSVDLQLRRLDGEVIWLQVHTEPVFADHICIGHVGTINDVTKHQQKVAELRSAANEDKLTGLLNRRGIEQAMVKAFQDARQERSDLILLVLDLDNFKAVNDYEGHEAGDWVLQKVALVMRQFTRDSDWVGRLGGDEFILVLPGCPVEQGERIANELVNHIAGISAERHLPQVTASVGMVNLRGDDQSAMDMLRRADKAAYAAKHAGRNQVFTETD
ncbi:hypothetical protein CWE09_02665 [Aliidiomarina minuta]|uniref:Diguanylate cyclase n=1 Tax=Aliidiomarina minuta TaxID=880057 RepID=A0A432W6N8_9GAMM|nr:diguanylate cyclase [Aliidiomarina minuta]RUO25649.1 hypothetical protein CWE09_02665 [Aliidiomarina minuta]